MGESLLNKTGNLTSPKEIYELFTKMDKKSEMNPSEYAIALESEDRDERKKAFENEFVLYNDNINMLSGLLTGQVKKNIFLSIDLNNLDKNKVKAALMEGRFVKRETDDEIKSDGDER